jgi:hypothetical protein
VRKNSLSVLGIVDRTDVVNICVTRTSTSLQDDNTIKDRRETQAVLYSILKFSVGWIRIFPRSRIRPGER